MSNSAAQLIVLNISFIILHVGLQLIIIFYWVELQLIIFIMN